MSGEDLVLVVGSYAVTGVAADDFEALNAGEAAGEHQVVDAVVLNRGADGKVDVQEHDSGAHVAGGSVLGGTAGLVVGLFAPPLLAATAVETTAPSSCSPRWDPTSTASSTKPGDYAC